jgi:hypothetical protein
MQVINLGLRIGIEMCIKSWAGVLDNFNRCAGHPFLVRTKTSSMIHALPVWVFCNLEEHFVLIIKPNCLYQNTN